MVVPLAKPGRPGEAKLVRIKIKPPAVPHRLDDMNEVELKRELDGLPERIQAASRHRDQLFSRLRERWSTAYVNDEEFVHAYHQAELAGQEVNYLCQRAIRASMLHAERYGKKLL